MPDLITPTTRPHVAWLQAHTEWDPDVHEDGSGLLPIEDGDADQVWCAA